MVKIHHLNCVKIVTPINDDVIGHCMLLEENNKLALVDAGFGLSDTQNPKERIGEKLIEMAGFRFNESWTAYKQIQQLGLDPLAVRHCVVSHLDPDHIGALIDFPDLTVHVAIEEYESFESGNPRYLPVQLAHNPKIRTYQQSTNTWFGLEARKIELGFSSAVYLVPLFGHTLGHCGVAVQQGDKWVFYIGDAYYLKVELSDASHPIHGLAKMRADNNNQRVESLDKIKALIRNNNEVEIFGYHDREELLPYLS